MVGREDERSVRGDVLTTSRADADIGVHQCGDAAAQQIAARQTGAVLTGHCGPNAFNVLAAAGINVFSGISGTVKEAVQQYQSGSLEAIAQADASPHSGMGGGGRGA